ncbi:MAG: hypothetical protein K1X57_22370 [Gemmataceae bacterium]|nr:hypothetical protein [Gemmataceae bacterium]
MDKDKLKKHHFWILLGLALLLLPVTLGGVWMSVAQATEERAKKVNDEKKKLADARTKGQNYLDLQMAQKKALEVRKDEVWKASYDAQKGLIEWPPALAHLDKLYFGDPISDEDRNTFRKADVYVPEYEALAQLIRPTEMNGGYQNVLRVVKWGERFPTDEDCWLALEDLCVQREMLRCVSEINQLMSKFENKTKESEKELKDRLKPGPDESVFRFVSPYWQLDLAVSSSSEGKGNDVVARGILKNISHRRLNVARIDFLVSLFDPATTQGRPGLLSVESDYVSVDEEVEFKNRPIKDARAAKPVIHAIEQKLDARFVPVKRVEKIALGYHSHRTADKPLVMCAMSEEAKKKAGTDAAPAADPTAPPGTAAAPTADRTPSGIDRLRYITVTKQVRRMPIGMVVVVDQAHVQDVLRALANSRLRFQTVQAHAARYRGGQNAMAAAGPAPAMPGPAPGGGNAGALLRGYPVPGGQPAMTNAPNPGPAMASGADDSATNLVEMSIYGLASIYEKYPPRPPVDPNAAPPAGTPPAATPPTDPAATPPAGTPKAG